MATRIGINGFGRIGRLVVRAAMKRRAPLEFVAVNDLTDAKTLAHLLRYDSVHRTWPEVGPAADGAIPIGGTRIKVLSEKDPTKLPWKDLGVELVVEATGRFTDRAGGAQHLAAGARAVLISAPAKDVDLTFVIGVNDDQFDRAKHTVVSIGSCTTNGLAPVAKVLHDTFGIEHGLMTTIHAYTNDQNVLDFPHKDLRRGPRGGGQHDPDLDRRRQGDRPGAARAQGQARRHLGARPGDGRLAGRSRLPASSRPPTPLR